MAERFSVAGVVPFVGPETENLTPIVIGSEAVRLDEYSRFKYGDGAVAQKYGHALAELALGEHSELLDCDAVYVTSSAYKVAPPASHALQAPFVRHASELARMLGRSTEFIGFKIDRETLTHGDYAGMSLSERERAMQQNGLSLPEDMDLHEQAVVVLDDIFVTGSHEKAIHTVLDLAGVRVAYYGYVLHVEGGAEHPSIEAAINTTAVRSIEDVLSLTRHAEFVPNARLCKYVLSRNIAELEYLCRSAPEDIVRQLVAYIEDDQLPSMEPYADSYSSLLTALDQATVS